MLHTAELALAGNSIHESCIAKWSMLCSMVFILEYYSEHNIFNKLSSCLLNIILTGFTINHTNVVITYLAQKRSIVDYKGLIFSYFEGFQSCNLYIFSAIYFISSLERDPLKKFKYSFANVIGINMRVSGAYDSTLIRLER